MSQPALIPPVGACAVCQKRLGVMADRATMEFEVFRAGKPDGARFTVHACGADHMAEAMRRVANVVETKLYPSAGSPEWVTHHGVMVLD